MHPSLVGGVGPGLEIVENICGVHSVPISYVLLFVAFDHYGKVHVLYIE